MVGLTIDYLHCIAKVLKIQVIGCKQLCKKNYVKVGCVYIHGYRYQNNLQFASCQLLQELFGTHCAYFELVF